MRNASVLAIAVLVLAVMTFENAEGRKMQLEEIRKNIKGLRKTCGPKANAPKELLDGASNGEFPADRRLMCYQKCVLNMMKAIKDDKLRHEVMIKQAELMLENETYERVKKAIDTCVGDVTSEDGCEASWQFVKCFYNYDKEVYFLP